MKDTMKTEKESPGPSVQELSSARPSPRTPRGKELVKYNSIKFGIFAKIVLSGEPFRESQNDYLNMLSAVRKAIRPRDWLEEILVEKLGFLYLRLSRVYRADAEVVPLLFKRIREALEEELPAVDTQWVGKDEVIVEQKVPPPDLLIRYESSIERQIDRVFDQLERLRWLRQGQPAPPEIKANPST